MVDTTFSADLQVDQWADGYYTSFSRENQFARYTGKSVDAPIQLQTDLGRLPGQDIWVSLLTKLSGVGVTGDNQLKGNEVALGNYGYKATVDQLRQAVAIGHFEQKKGKIAMLEAARPALLQWRLDAHRDSIIAALLCPNLDGKTAYASTAEGDKDLMLRANADRFLFGAAKSNTDGWAIPGTEDHSASLLNVDSVSDVLSPGIISLAKRMLRTASPSVRPIRVGSQGEWYVLFVGSMAMRDLKSDTTMTQANREARERGVNNPLFVDGDLLWDGVIIHEVPEIDVLTGVGAAGIDVSPCFMVGAQALVYAVGEEPHPIEDQDDYGNWKGVGIAEISCVDKLMFNDKQNGMLTLYVSGVADA